jgi:hypothetical protein
MLQYSGSLRGRDDDIMCTDDNSNLGSYSRASDIDSCIVAPTLYKSGDGKLTGVYVYVNHHQHLRQTRPRPWRFIRAQWSRQTMVVNGDMRDRRNDHPQSFETCAHEGHAAPESGLMSADNPTRHPSWHVKKRTLSPPQFHRRMLASGVKGTASHSN